MASKTPKTQPATKKAGAKTASRPATEKPARRKTAAAKPKATPPLDNQARYHRVQVAAYYLAERDGFRKNSVEYWTAAEIQIRAQLGEI